MDAKEQNKLAGIFLLIHGGLYGLLMLFVMVVYGFMGVALFASARREQDQFAGLIFVIVVLVVLAVAVLFVVPQIVGGWKMIKQRPNARTWGIIGSIIACMSFPLGTAAGVFGLIFLFGDAGRQLYLGTGQPQNYNPPQPPPPSSWQ